MELALQPLTEKIANQNEIQNEIAENRSARVKMKERYKHAFIALSRLNDQQPGLENVVYLYRLMNDATYLKVPKTENPTGFVEIPIIHENDFTTQAALFKAKTGKDFSACLNRRDLIDKFELLKAQLKVELEENKNKKVQLEQNLSTIENSIVTQNVNNQQIIIPFGQFEAIIKAKGEIIKGIERKVEDSIRKAKIQSQKRGSVNPLTSPRGTVDVFADNPPLRVARDLLTQKRIADTSDTFVKVLSGLSDLSGLSEAEQATLSNELPSD